MEKNKHIQVSKEYDYDNDFTHEQLRKLRKKDPWIVKQLAASYFWIFCMLLAPDFYNARHYYLRTLCNFIQGTWEDKDAKYVALSIPPQHGKSRTMFMFALWLLMKDKKMRIFNISYNEDYALEASKNMIEQIKRQKDETNEDDITINDFVNLQIKRGDGSKNSWSVEGGRQTWFSSSYGAGSVTGKSAQLVILDDLIKSYAVSVSKSEKKKINSFLSATLFSRQSGGMKIYIPQTRWCKDDPIGFLLRAFGDNVRTLKMIAYDPEDGTMLCDDILTREAYEDIVHINKVNNTEEIIEANYNQEPVDVKGCLITHYNKWTELPAEINIKRSFSVTDTSDTGGDFFCSLCGYITRDNNIYITDLLYTSESVEHTVPALAKMIKNNRIKYNVIESNNGGRVIALDVKKELKTNGWDVPVKWFHQSNNKETRIADNAGKVMNRIWWPPEFDRAGKWEQFFEDFTNFQKVFTDNEHDDCIDVATMAVEFSEGRLKEK